MSKCRPLDRTEQAMEMMNDRASSLNVVTISRISGSLTPQVLTKALLLVQSRHPRLNTRIIRKLNSLYFESGIIDLPLNIVTVSRNEGWQKVALREFNQKIESDKYLARFTFIQIEEDKSDNYLIATIHHGITDGLSSVQLHSEILKSCQKVISGEDIDETNNLDILPSVTELIPNSLTGLVSQTKSILFLLKLKFRDLLYKPESLGFEEYVPISLRSAGMVHKQLQPEITQHLINISRRESTTVQGALTAGILKAVATKINQIKNEKDTKPVCLSCQTYIDLRKRLQPEIKNENLGILVSFINLCHTVEKSQLFWDIARNIKQKLELYLTKNDIFYAVLTSKFVTEYYLSHPKEPPVSIVITNIGKVNIPQNYGTLKLEEISFVPVQSAFGGVFGVAVSTFNEKMFLNFMFSKPSISQETAEEIANETLKNLTEACFSEVN